MSHTRGRVACALLVALAGVAMALVLRREVVNVPFWDDWSTARLVAGMQDGTLELRDLWAPYAGHRIFLPRLLSLGLARTVGWSNVAQVYAGFALAVLTVAVVWRMLALTVRERDERPFLAVLAVSALLLFSPGQAQNWVQGFNTGWFAAGFGGVAAVWSVSRFPGSWCALLGAMLLGAAASVSIGSGLAVWPAVLAGLLLRRREWGWPAIAAWSVVSLAAIAVHFQGLGFQLGQLVWVDPSKVTAEERSAPLYVYVWHRLPQAAAYMVCMLGSPLAGWGGLGLSGAVGAAGLVALAWAGQELWRHPGDRARPRWIDAVPWIQVAVLGVGAALLVASGRMVFGLQQAVSSRYVTSATLFWIGVSGTLAVALHGVSADGRLPRSKAAAVAAALVLLALGAGCALSFAAGYGEMESYRERMHASLYYVYRHPIAPPASLRLTHALVPRDLKESIAAAQRARQGPFLPGAEETYEAELAREARSWNERLGSGAYAMEPAASVEALVESARMLEQTGNRYAFVPRGGAAAFRVTLAPGSRSEAGRVLEIRSEHAMYAVVNLRSELGAVPEIGLVPLPGADGAPRFRTTRASGAETFTIELYYPLGSAVQQDSVEVAFYCPR